MTGEITTARTPTSHPIAEKSTHGRKRAWTTRERHKSAPINGFPSCFGELANALSQHGVGDLRETSDVRAHHVVAGMAVLRGRRGGVVMEIIRNQKNF